MSDYALCLSGVSKRFRTAYIPKHMTLKEAIIRGHGFGQRERTRFVDALVDITLNLPRGNALGVIGSNGSGKSTLLRLLAGVIKPDSGSVRVTGEIAPLLSLGLGFHPDLTGRENARIGGLIMGLRPSEIEARLSEIAAFAELGEFMDSPVRAYSTGMYMRLAFAVAINVQPDILLLDEVFAVGDAEFSRKCRQKMNSFRDERRTIVLVSHDTSNIESFCDVVLWLEHGRIKMLGAPTDVVSAYTHAAAHTVSV